MLSGRHTQASYTRFVDKKRHLWCVGRLVLTGSQVNPTNTTIPAYPMFIEDGGTTILAESPGSVGILLNGVAVFRCVEQGKGDHDHMKQRAEGGRRRHTSQQTSKRESSRDKASGTSKQCTPVTAPRLELEALI